MVVTVKRFSLLLSLVCTLMMSSPVSAHDEVMDFFCPRESSFYDICSYDTGLPIGRGMANFGLGFRRGKMIARNGRFVEMSERLLPMEMLCYDLAFRDGQVIADEWWRQAMELTDEPSVVNRSLVMFKLPGMDRPAVWENEVKDGKGFSRRWVMTAVRDGDSVKVSRAVYDGDGRPVPEQCSIEYYEKGKGKVKEVIGCEEKL